MFPEGRIIDFVIVGAIALMVVGPKDLPILMRKVGQFIARMRGMAAEFRASFDELARQSELDELRKEVETLRNARPLDMAADHIADPGTQQVFDDIQASFAAGGAQFAPPLAHQPEEPAPAAVMTPLAAPEPPPSEPPAKPPRKPRARKKPETTGTAP